MNDRHLTALTARIGALARVMPRGWRLTFSVQYVEGTLFLVAAIFKYIHDKPDISRVSVAAPWTDVADFDRLVERMVRMACIVDLRQDGEIAARAWLKAHGYIYGFGADIHADVSKGQGRTCTRAELQQAIDSVLHWHARAPQNGSRSDAYTLLADVCQRVIDLDVDVALKELRELPARCASCGWTEGTTWGGHCKACEEWREREAAR